MKTTSIIKQAEMATQAQELCRLGARMALLEHFIKLPRERLLGIYRESTGRSPSKGQYPFSSEILLTYPLNVQASLFHGLYRFFQEHAEEAGGLRHLILAYSAYLDHASHYSLDNRLDINRAWLVTRFLSSGVLSAVECRICYGQFIADSLHAGRRLACCLCVPSPHQGAMSRASPAAPPAVQPV